MRLPLGTSDYLRSIAETPAITGPQSFFEADPTNQTDQVALLCRPGAAQVENARHLGHAGIYSQPGTFDEALFAVSETRSTGSTRTRLSPPSGRSDSTGFVSMAATDTYLFIADGTVSNTTRTTTLRRDADRLGRDHQRR
jgi:hypothetical protein